MKEENSSFPSQQLFVLGLCRICEPIAFMSIFPYVYFMVSSFHVTEDSRKIALYAGAVTSAFTFAEFSAGIFWGRMSDKFGRKPVLIMGLIGTALSMLLFGFASNLPMALLARALGGLLNGNIGVLQTTVAELVTDKKHQPRAYSIMPFVWCLGSIIGPALGGALAQPCQNYPSFFPRNTIFDRYPFLLPNLVCAVVLLFGIAIGILFLEETHAEKKLQRDRGREVGKWLMARFAKSDIATQGKPSSQMEDSASFLFDDPPPGYQSTENSPLLSSLKAPAAPPQETPRAQNRGFMKALTPNVLYIVLGYGILAYHSVSFDQLMPIFLSTPTSDKAVELPFKFLGGLALTTKAIGFMLAVQGVYSMIAQLWLFPCLVGRFGTLQTYRFALCVWPLIYLGTPYLILLPASLQIPSAYAALLCKITLHVIAFPSSQILLANASPSNVLGSVNGIAASTASLSRSFGPTITGYLHSKGLESGYSILSWWVCGVFCVLGALESFWIKDEDSNTGDISEKSSNDDCEIGAQNTNPRESYISSRASVEDLMFLSRSSCEYRSVNYNTENVPSTISEDIIDLDLNHDRPL